MNGRRAALLATPLAIALALIPLGPAGAVPGDEDPSGRSALAPAPERAFGDAAPAPERTFDTPLAESPDLAAQPEIAEAVSGRAATALRLINEERSRSGVRTLKQDNALNDLAQRSAVAWSTGNEDHPDLSLPLPGFPAADSTVYEYVVVGDASYSVAAFVHDLLVDIVNDTDSTHIGIGYYQKTVGGVLTGHLWVLTVEYDFRDVGPSVPFHEDIAWMNWAKVTTGYADGTYRPSTKVSRAHMAAFLYRFLTEGAPKPTCDAGPRMFTDIAADYPFCGEIEWLANTGITTGYADGTYRPLASVSRQHMAAFLSRALTPTELALSVAPACEPGPRMFTDVPVDHPFCPEIEWLAGTGITTGYTDGTFRPRTLITRGQMSAFLYRAWSTVATF